MDIPPWLHHDQKVLRMGYFVFLIIAEARCVLSSHQILFDVKLPGLGKLTDLITMQQSPDSSIVTSFFVGKHMNNDNFL